MFCSGTFTETSILILILYFVSQLPVKFLNALNSVYIKIYLRIQKSYCCIGNKIIIFFIAICNCLFLFNFKGPKATSTSLKCNRDRNFVFNYIFIANNFCYTLFSLLVIIRVNGVLLTIGVLLKNLYRANLNLSQLLYCTVPYHICIAICYRYKN